MRQAIIFARRLLDVEPAHERSHRRLIDLYYRIDDRTRAVRQWRLCKDALEQELGIRPSKRTAALAALVGEDAGTPTAADDDLADLRGEIAALQRSVDAISARLRKESVG
jgi:DNA-binding SARP family transcriptional activator